jgi:hypothetical protein
MSGRGPEPKELRASLVDSGWSSVAPPAIVDAPNHGEPGPDDPASRLPNYEDLSQAPVVTQIDTEIQARLRAMQRASLVDSHRTPGSGKPPPPPSRPSRPAPPSLPPPPPSVAPPRPSEVPLPSFAPPAVVEAEPPLPSYPLPGPQTFEPATAGYGLQVSAALPSINPAGLRAPAAPMFSFAPTAPSPLAALRQRVRFAGGEVPLWSLLVPMVLLLSLGSAFAAAALGSPDERPPMPLESASAAPTPSAPASVADAMPDAPPSTTSQAPALPASSIDTEALEARRAEELTKDEALALAAGRRKREVSRVAQLRQKLSRDPGLFQDAATLAELRRAAEDPLTAPDALSTMAEAPGSLSADLLYEMWTGTVVRNGATELARSLVFSKEVRAKASPELAIALDLRIAETCEQNRALLPRVLGKGDRRSLALLAKLSRKFGCGANKRLDCYPCLRADKSVDDAMAEVKKRREPKPFSGK